jgi:hypothetical protein
MLKKYLLIVPLVVGCSQGGDDRFKEKAQIESDSITQAERDAQNARAAQMEGDLARRQNFFQTVKGTFEGSFQTELGEFQVRILLVPSLNPMRLERPRLPEEVASDLNNLHFNAQMQMWASGNPGSAGGCRVENIRPDLKTGIINIVSASCPNVYFLAISNPEEFRNLTPKDYYLSLVDDGGSAKFAENIISGASRELNEVTGFIRMTNQATSYYFRAKRVQQ